MLQPDYLPILKIVVMHVCHSALLVENQQQKESRTASTFVRQSVLAGMLQAFSQMRQAYVLGVYLQLVSDLHQSASCVVLATQCTHSVLETILCTI